MIFTYNEEIGSARISAGPEDGGGLSTDVVLTSEGIDEMIQEVVNETQISNRRRN